MPGGAERAPVPGHAVALEPGLRRIVAPNPSPMTHWGTNTYLLGEGPVTVIDPGPDDPGHLTAILEAAPEVEAILVTHAHRDHSPLARALSAATGAPVMAFGPPQAGRRPVMARLAETGLAGGGEGVDAAFRPDRELAHDTAIGTGEDRIEALHLPGHMAGHLGFAWRGAVFTGDHAMGWASTMISPPDGDLAAFFRSCERLLARSDRRHYPAHGAPLDDPAARLRALVEHRQARTRQILDALATGPATVETLTRTIYADTPAALIPAAMRNVLAHLIALWEEDRVHAAPDLSATAEFRLARR